ncbi:DUF7266 family protein [Haloarcula onubensis]|uniref:Uncharacterized protein n=1 Tax=Haloarcula onubensis TaxID=2950539 RepID=A0ABU2FJN1_9EURY|nr:hypothetical protein [Halomicroarcula sp. S3CR25-11]MDS0280965.1 hypothetical protein [Halomicroarcula sp. S3CR25-11]
MDDRGLSTVVEKLLSLSVVVLYITLLTTVLYGGSLPAYRGAVGAQLGERALAEATAEVERAVPPPGRAAAASRRVDIPATIDGAGYRIRANGTHLLLVHPDAEIGGTARPVLPDRVGNVTGEWDSGADTVVTVDGAQGNLTVRLGARG